LWIFFQVGHTPKEIAVGNSLDVDAGGRVQKIALDESVKLSSSSIMPNGLQTEAHACKRHKKLKKRALKCQVASMPKYSRLLSLASSSLQKKKKHKRNRRHILGVKNLSRENLLDGDCISADMRPSTSESIRTMPLDSTPPLRKGTKSGSKKGAKNAAAKDLVNSNGDCLMDNMIDGELRHRIDQNGTVLASDKPLEKSSDPIASSSLLADQLEAGRPNGPKDSKREVVQNGLMSMLTRGLEETQGK
jgi:ubiquitin carboxyl-terminal hydrolase 36/42